LLFFDFGAGLATVFLAATGFVAVDFAGATGFVAFVEVVAFTGFAVDLVAIKILQDFFIISSKKCF
jgi:hypothetical protein